MRILIAGASGFLGTALRVRFAEQGHEVRRLVRRTASTSSEFSWDPMAGRIDTRAFTDVELIVNLAGPPLFTRPWTPSRRELLREARIESTRLLAETLVERYASAEEKPLWIQASSAGWYGARPDATQTEPYDESAPAGDDFPARLARDWEAATGHAVGAGIPVIFIRNGMVLDAGGSTLKLIKPIFRAGLGARMGDGRQRMPMISLHDWLRAVVHLIERRLPGPYNLTIPEPPTNAEFTRTLSELLGRRALFAAPGKTLRFALGELAEQLTGDQYVVPRALLDLGFTFDGSDVRSTLELALTGALRPPDGG